jgi:hypothetical protein
MIYRCSDLAIFSEEQVLDLWRQISMSKMRTRESLKVVSPEDTLREVSLSSTTIERLCGLIAGD